MRKCASCGGTRVRRVHRTFWERFQYLAIYACRDCHHERRVPRRYQYHFGSYCRCPKCGTTRLKKLKDRDPIDPLPTGFLNFLERLAGGVIYHCCFCRIQFYDGRVLYPLLPTDVPAKLVDAPDTESAEQVMAPPGTASSGA